jgi:hypothetical protein
VTTRRKAIRAEAAASTAVLAILALIAPSRDGRAADIIVDSGTPMVVTGPTQVTGDRLIVGNVNSGQSLLIESGGEARHIAATIGYGDPGNFSNNNVITVTGANSLLQNIHPSTPPRC